MSTDPIAALFAAAADTIEQRDPTRDWQSGPEVWRTLALLAAEMWWMPAADTLARHVGATQLQFWDVDKATAIAALRELAGRDHDLDDLRRTYDAAEHERARQALVKMLGDPDSTDSVTRVAAQVGHRLRLAQRDRDRAIAERDALANRLINAYRRDTNPEPMPAPAAPEQQGETR